MSDEPNYQQKRTSQDELRDRIANVIHGVNGDHWDDMAQAVIDDLGLEWEQRLRTWDDMDGESRVVGKWGQV